jgi:hypothetical protein
MTDRTNTNGEKKKETEQLRECLSCGKYFPSPAKNVRLCKECKYMNQRIRLLEAGEAV